MVKKKKGRKPATKTKRQLAIAARFEVVHQKRGPCVNERLVFQPSIMLPPFKRRHNRDTLKALNARNILPALQNYLKCLVCKRTCFETAQLPCGCGICCLACVKEHGMLTCNRGEKLKCPLCLLEYNTGSLRTNTALNKLSRTVNNGKSIAVRKASTRFITDMTERENIIKTQERLETRLLELDSPGRGFQDAAVEYASRYFLENGLFSGKKSRIENRNTINGPGGYNWLYMDPPWHHGISGTSVGTDQHYETISVDQIISMPFIGLCRRDCALFMWTTVCFLPEAFRLARAHGFEYVTVLCNWIKVSSKNQVVLGPGQTTRQSCEYLLYFKRGNWSKYVAKSTLCGTIGDHFVNGELLKCKYCKEEVDGTLLSEVRAYGVTDCIFCKKENPYPQSQLDKLYDSPSGTLVTYRGVNSEKPPEAYDFILRIAGAYPGLEAFGRVERPYCDTWGNEIVFNKDSIQYSCLGPDAWEINDHVKNVQDQNAVDFEIIASKPGHRQDAKPSKHADEVIKSIKKRLNTKIKSLQNKIKQLENK